MVLGTVVGGGRMDEMAAEKLLKLRAQVVEAYTQPVMLAHYARQTPLGLSQAEQRLIAQYVTAPARVLVLGCGMGREMLALAAQGCEVVGIDVADAMLRQARIFLRDADVPPERIALQLADVTHLPYRGQSFTHVLMLEQAIQHIPGRAARQQVFREIQRVLQPGGYALLSSYQHASSFLYLLLAGRRMRQQFGAMPAQGRPTLTSLCWQRIQRLTGAADGETQGRHKVVKRLVWELHPTIGSVVDPLPLGLRLAFGGVCGLTNAFRRMRSWCGWTTPAGCEPNDLFLDVPDFRWHWRLSRGNLFMHFPATGELAAEIQRSGLELVQVASVEELEGKAQASVTLTRASRLLFYVIRQR